MAERYGRPIDPHSPAPAAPAYAAAPDDDPLPAPAPSVRERPATTNPAAAVSTGATSAGGTVPSASAELQKAQEQLLNLRRQQEQIERQKRDLEELSRRQEELENGRTEMLEKLTRALVVLERQSNEAQKRVEQLHLAGESFASHLSALEGINPKSWASADMQKELNRALGMVDHARTEYGQQRARFAADIAEGTASTEGGAPNSSAYDEMFPDSRDRSFLYWLKAGVAFTLPIFLLGLLTLFILGWYLLTR